MNEAGGGGGTHARRRLRGFGIHLLAYFAVMAVLVGLSVFFFPENSWVLAPVVGWGAVLAVHAAYAMGLFDVFRGK
jgi:2TM domain